MAWWVNSSISSIRQPVLDSTHWATPEAAQTMVADPRWRRWTNTWPATLCTKRRLDNFALIVGMAAVIGITEELEAYASRLRLAVSPSAADSSHRMQPARDPISGAAEVAVSSRPDLDDRSLVFRRDGADAG